ncbi:cysteine hydrolase family protein [Kytococcus sedentarius]|uniref:cysteine hydrolase family protein n=1 Tax=Kytococcus sedentarius TaxID=1276 RepID=UPI0035BBE9CA
MSTDDVTPEPTDAQADERAFDDGAAAMGVAPEPWLVVIDPQAIFASPEASEWGSAMFAEVVPTIRRLVDAHPGRVVITRFVADEEPTGSWVPYYREWPFAQVPDADPLYALVPELADVDALVVTEPTFGKWHDMLQAVVGETPHLRLAGVATDCCVIATALPAADDGAFVEVVTDACAGSTPANHELALQQMALFAPQITQVTSGEVLSGR